MNDDLKRRLERQNEIAEEILAADPSVGFLSAIIIAGDRAGAEDADRRLDAGEITFEEGLYRVGSYARLDWALRAQERGATTRDRLLDLLPSLWRASDPDDTDVRFLELWREAWRRNGKRTIVDDHPLPQQRTLTVYRGQDEGVKVGWAWSLDKDIAERFARGAGLRQSNRSGIIYRAEVRRSLVMGYLTKRGEEEVIIDPFGPGIAI